MFLRRLAVDVTLAAFASTSLLSAAHGAINAGDVAIIGYDSTNPDEFRIVFLSSVSANDVVNFTDNGWINTGAFRTTENSLTYIVPTGGHAAGTTVNWANGQVITGTGWNSSGPTNFSFNSSGDSLIAYTGTLASPTLIYGLQQGATWDADATSASTSSEPTAANNGTLVSRVTTNAFGGNNGYYSAPMTAGTKTLLQVAISNATNWTASADPTRQASSNFKSAFTVNSSASLYWDANDVTSGTGGTGTWDAMTNNKFSNSTNDTRFRWVNSTTGNDHTAVFAGTAGTVSVAAGGVTASGMTFNVDGYTVQNNTVTLAGSTPTITVTTAAHTATVSSKISGSNGLTKDGAGKAILTGANDYSGGTILTSGTLLANNSSGSATGTGNVTVNGGTFGGTGAVSGAVTANNSGTIAPGGSAATTIESLDLGGALTFNTGSHLAYEINSGAAAASRADLLNVNGNLSLTGTVALDLTDAGSTLLSNGTKLTLVSYSGTWNGGTFNGHADDSVLSIGVNSFLINYNDTSGGANFGGGLYGKFLTLSAVPEASSFVFGGLICGVLGMTFAGRTLHARRTKRKTQSDPSKAED
jgi:autotransporter-associated beta strand protein